MAFIVDESFTTGSRPGGWYVLSDGNFGYTTSPAPLEGTYSLRVASTDTIGNAFFLGGAETGEQWGHFMLNMDALPASFQEVFYLVQDDVTTKVYDLYVMSDGKLLLTFNGDITLATTSGGISAATTYHIFWRYNPGSGSNGQLEVWANTTNDRAGTSAGLHLSLTNGAQTVSPLGLVYLPGNQSYIVDTVQWADTDEFAGGGGGGTVVPVFMNQYRQRWG